MIRNVFIFLGTFLVGALAALVVRAASFQPHAAADGTQHTTATAAVDHSQHTTAAATPLQTPNPKLQTTGAPPPAASAPVNTVCAICGMSVDPKVPTAEYQGKTIGFGCKMCPPKFKADPDRYGPLYLRNEVVKR